MSKPIHLKSDRKILIANDHAEDLMALEFAVAIEGYQYDKANNGVETVKKIRTFMPHLVIVNEEMTANNGITIARQIRKFKKYQGIPFIFLVSKTIQLKDKEFYVSEGDYFCKKTIDSENLKKIIREMLAFE